MVVERAGVADVVQTKSFVKLRITRRIAGRRLDVSEGVRGRGGDREEEAYSASRHLRRTQSGPAAGAGSRAKRDGVGLPSRSVGGRVLSQAPPGTTIGFFGPWYSSVLPTASFVFGRECFAP